MLSTTTKLDITIPIAEKSQNLINDLDGQSPSPKSESQSSNCSKEDSEHETNYGLVCINCQGSYNNLKEMYCKGCYKNIFTPDKTFVIEIEANSNTMNSELGIISNQQLVAGDSVTKMGNQFENSTADLGLNSLNENSAPSGLKFFKNITEKIEPISLQQVTDIELVQPRRNPTRNAALKRKAEAPISTTKQQKKTKKNQDQADTNCSNNDINATSMVKITFEPSTKSNNGVSSCTKSVPSARTKDSESSSSITTENASENLKDIEAISAYSEISNKDNTKEKAKNKYAYIEESQDSEDDETNEKGYFFFDEGYDMFIQCFSEEDDFIDAYEVRDNIDKFECWPENSEIPQHLDSIVSPKEGIIKMGKAYQTDIPKFRKKNPLRNKPKMKWNPEKLSQEAFEDYIEKLLKMAKVNMDKMIEQRSIEILLESEYNVEKALEFVKRNVNNVRNTITFKNRKSM